MRETGETLRTKIGRKGQYRDHWGYIGEKGRTIIKKFHFILEVVVF